MPPGFKFPLLETVRDQVTDFTGKITARFDQAHGPERYQVEALVNGEIKSEWINVDRLSVAPAPKAAE